MFSNVFINPLQVLLWPNQFDQRFDKIFLRMTRAIKTVRFKNARKYNGNPKNKFFMAVDKNENFLDLTVKR